MGALGIDVISEVNMNPGCAGGGGDSSPGRRGIHCKGNYRSTKNRQCLYTNRGVRGVFISVSHCSLSSSSTMGLAHIERMVR